MFCLFGFVEFRFDQSAVSSGQMKSGKITLIKIILITFFSGKKSFKTKPKKSQNQLSHHVTFFDVNNLKSNKI